MRVFSSRAALGLAASLAAVSVALAQTPIGDDQFRPQVGQAGKDVIWVPADLVMVHKMLDLARVRPHEIVVDLGSGDGRTVIEAARRGATGIGVELNRDLVALSQRIAQREGLAAQTRFVVQDLFEFDLSQVDVITLFLLDSINLRLRPKLLELRPGTRIVSNTFTMGDWQPDEAAIDEARPSCTFNCRAQLWFVPAKVGGDWVMGNSRLELTQTYQMLTGTLSTGDVREVVAGRVRGAEIRLQIGGTEYVGRSNGEALEGTFLEKSARRPWRAIRPSAVTPQFRFGS